MKGDFSHDRFDFRKGFNRVLKQQGRVDLDADCNEQAAIQRHLLRTLIVDLVGRTGGPRDNCGFGIVNWEGLTTEERDALKARGLEPEVGDFVFGQGRYYVEGLLIENEAPASYRRQGDWHGERMAAGRRYLAYLDVWERHITYIEDGSIREVAIGVPDTCTRVKTMWQVKLLEAPTTGSDTSDLEARLKAAQRDRAAVEGDIEKELPCLETDH